METFTSNEYCTQDSDGFEGYYSHDRGSEELIIRDSLIGDDTIATQRARAELLKNGYAERWITIESIFIPNLKQNDIISYNGIKWIVKEISLSFNPPVLKQTIKGLRYE